MVYRRLAISKSQGSHDRAFLSQTTDRLLEVKADGTLAEVPGGIDAWIARAAGVATSLSEDTDEESSQSKSKLLRETEKEMARLERQIAKLNEKLLTITDYEEAGRVNKELLTLRQSLSDAEERWLVLGDA